MYYLSLCLEYFKEENKKVIKCNRAEINSGDAITYLAKNYKIKDIHIIDKSLEDIVKNIYKQTKTQSF